MNRIALGTDWMIAVPNSSRWNFMPTRKADAILNEAVALGITTFDTARIYASEGIIGRFLRNHPSKRSQFTIISKGGHPGLFWRTPLNRKKLMQDLEDSLKALGTDYIDIYLIHFDDPQVPATAIADWSQELLRSGKIRKIGYANIDLERLKQIREILKVSGIIPWVSNELSVLPCEPERWTGAQNISRNREYIEYLKVSRLPFLGYSPLGRGYLKKNLVTSDNPTITLLKGLAQKYEVSVFVIALNYILNLSPQFYAVIGTTNPVHLKENLRALKFKMTDEEYIRLQDFKTSRPK